ncbi:MAG: MerR family transcriptional regulator [Myxococcota bacterium]|nr:MerR family transcriptional regulator [Myxococcota bacterium]
MAESKRTLYRIGELAARTDKTVRALHLYEELGLLTPAERTKSGYRMYDNGNVERIQYISRLQHLDLTLGDIAELLADWRSEGQPESAMARLRDVYATRLKAVKQKRLALEALERELVESVSFLDGCTGCGQQVAAVDACSTCVGAQRAHETKPTLITGLLAH